MVLPLFGYDHPDIRGAEPSILVGEGVRCTPHGTGVGLAANMHVLATVADPPYAEYDLNDDSPLQRELLKDPLRAVDGVIRLRDSPGLGVELDPAAVERYRVDVSPCFLALNSRA